MKVRGIAHIHSNFSDAFISLEGIKKEAQDCGAKFVLIADHLAQIKDFNKLKTECLVLSDDTFLMLPGIEVESREGYHFLIYNLYDLPSFIVEKETSFLELYSALCDRDCLLVWAHASIYSKPPSREILEKLDGIEVWNTKYESRHAPNIRSLRLALKNNLVPFAGVDAHGPFSLRKLSLELALEKLDRGELARTLRRGEFKIVNSFFTVDLQERLNSAQFFFFSLINKFFAPIRYPCAFVAKSPLRIPKFFIKLFHKVY